MSNLCNVGEVVFSRKDVVDQAEIDDMWDDTALIEAYDKAVNLAYHAAHASLKSQGDLDDVELLSHNRFNKNSDIVKNSGEDVRKTKKNRKDKRKRKWKVGDACLAKYAEDDFWYEATIININRPKNKCVIKFNGYESEHEQNIGGLHRIPESSVENKADDSADESSSALDTGSVLSDATPSCASSFKTANYAMQNLGNKSSPKIDSALQKNMTFLPPPMPPAFLQHNSGTPNENEAMASMLMSWYMSGYHTGYYQAIRDVKTRKLDK